MLISGNCSASWRLADEFAATFAKSACADWISVAEACPEVPPEPVEGPVEGAEDDHATDS